MSGLPETLLFMAIGFAIAYFVDVRWKVRGKK